jgi:hypothetical protein
VFEMKKETVAFFAFAVTILCCASVGHAADLSTVNESNYIASIDGIKGGLESAAIAPEANAVPSVEEESGTLLTDNSLDHGEVADIPTDLSSALGLGENAGGEVEKGQIAFGLLDNFMPKPDEKEKAAFLELSKLMSQNGLAGADGKFDYADIKPVFEVLWGNGTMPQDEGLKNEIESRIDGEISKMTGFKGFAGRIARWLTKNVKLPQSISDMINKQIYSQAKTMAYKEFEKQMSQTLEAQGVKSGRTIKKNAAGVEEVELGYDKGERDKSLVNYANLMRLQKEITPVIEGFSKKGSGTGIMGMTPNIRFVNGLSGEDFKSLSEGKFPKGGTIEWKKKDATPVTPKPTASTPTSTPVPTQSSTPIVSTSIGRVSVSTSVSPVVPEGKRIVF